MVKSQEWSVPYLCCGDRRRGAILLVGGVAYVVVVGGKGCHILTLSRRIFYLHMISKKCRVPMWRRTYYSPHSAFTEDCKQIVLGRFGVLIE
jgi:hypothetical protein